MDPSTFCTHLERPLHDRHITELINHPGERYAFLTILSRERRPEVVPTSLREFIPSGVARPLFSSTPHRTDDKMKVFYDAMEIVPSYFDRKMRSVAILEVDPVITRGVLKGPPKVVIAFRRESAQENGIVFVEEAARYLGSKSWLLAKDSIRLKNHRSAEKHPAPYQMVRSTVQFRSWVKSIMPDNIFLVSKNNFIPTQSEIRKAFIRTKLSIADDRRPKEDREYQNQWEESP